MLHSSRNYSVEHLEELCPVEATKMHNTLSLCNTVLILDLTQEEAAVFCFLWVSIFLSSCSVYKFLLSNLTYLNAPQSSSFFIL